MACSADRKLFLHLQRPCTMKVKKSLEESKKFLLRLRNEVESAEFELRYRCNNRKQMGWEDPKQRMEDAIYGEQLICQLSQMLEKYVQERGLVPANVDENKG